MLLTQIKIQASDRKAWSGLSDSLDGPSVWDEGAPVLMIQGTAGSLRWVGRGVFPWEGYPVCRILICSGQSLVEVSLYLSCRGIGLWFAQECLELSNKSITFQAAPQLKPVTSRHHVNVLHIL